MAVNKVVYNGQTVIDITDTSIDVDKIPDGSVIYLASGERIVGEAIVYSVYNGLDKTDSGFALDARQGKALNDALSGKVNTSDVATSAEANTYLGITTTS